MRVRAWSWALAALLGTLGPALMPMAAAAAGPQADGPLSAPVDTSLAPPALIEGGVASTSIGSGGERGTAVRLDTGLLGAGTRAFLLAGTGRGPHWHDRPSASGGLAAVGVETELPHGTTLSLTAGHEWGRFGEAGPFGPVEPRP